MKTCIVIPFFDHLAQFRDFLPQLTSLGMPIVVVDDASPADSAAGLAELLRTMAPGSVLLRHGRNGGKGAAVMTGLRAAYERRFTHAVQLDADGQHDIADLPAFLEAAKQRPDALICGQPQFDDGISPLRYYARYITLSFSWLETLSTEIRDALCGFRLYPLRPIVTLLDRCKPGKRMAFDPEILVRSVWAGLSLHFIPVHVRYPETGKSHFHYVVDNAEIAWMHVRLIAGMVPRIPQLARQRRMRAGPQAGV